MTQATEPPQQSQPVELPLNEPQPARGRNRRKLWIILGVAVLVLTGGATALVLTLTGQTFKATGTVTILDIGSGFPDDGGIVVGSTLDNIYVDDSGYCGGTNGYSDLVTGAGVTVYNSSGDMVGIGELRSPYGTGLGCTFNFTVADVPSGEGPYAVEVSHRGRIGATEEDLTKGSTRLSIGD